MADLWHSNAFQGFHMASKFSSQKRNKKFHFYVKNFQGLGLKERTKFASDMADIEDFSLYEKNVWYCEEFFSVNDTRMLAR